jgi:DNA-binding transcriptional LysR family regulator
MLNFDAIHTFCTIVDLGNFRKAAQKLHRTQPAISQQLKKLEQEVGHILLDRKLRKPTPEGEILYHKGKELLRHAKNIHREIEDTSQSPRRELRVGTSDTNALYFLPPYVSLFMDQWPEVKLEIFSQSTNRIATQVIEGKLDLGIITLPLTRPELETLTLYEQRLVLVLPNEHPLANKKSISLNQLKNESFVLLNESTRTGSLIHNFFAEHQFNPKVNMYSGSFEVIKRYIAQGIGISFLPEMGVPKEATKNLTTVRINKMPKVGIGAILQTDSYQHKAAQAFLELLQSRL